MNNLRKLEVNPTKVALLEAAKDVLLSDGYTGLSTRAIAAAADTQMSQIRYHFGSKEGIVLALFEYMNAQLIMRQTDLFDDPNIALSAKWDVACDYLDEDIASGYVRVFLEMIAVGWANPQIGQAVRESLDEWTRLHSDLAREAERNFGSLGPFSSEDIPALVHSAFVGTEALYFLGSERNDYPLRRALRRIGDVFRFFENQS
jgi:AcrR family transcriptional regulator